MSMEKSNRKNEKKKKFPTMVGVSIKKFDRY